MSRYIDADAFLKKIEKYSLSNGTTLGKHSGIADEIIDILKATPTADVVEVVRCKDCKYFILDEGDGLGYCTCQKIPMNFVGELYPTEDFYCSYGERKEEK